MTRPQNRKSLRFMKWHGAGNDFVMIDSRGRPPVVSRALAAAMGDRHRGVGFDQLAEIRSSDVADIDLDFWNADGSRAGACGNATRCVARYMMDQTGAERLSIRTGPAAGAGRGPRTSASGRRSGCGGHGQSALRVFRRPVAVGMGNPHCVFFVDDAEAVDVAGLGPGVETDPLFPEATNVEFAQVRRRDEVRMRVWERGTGITQACGSGACATLVAAVQRGLTDRKVRMELDGGWLTLDWCADGVWMTGPTAFVFEAELTPAFLDAL